jgi:hypothetical protein
MEYSIWYDTFSFFLQCVAFQYPKYPNEMMKKKYYEFFQTLPLFIPIKKISSQFESILNEFPVQPYLDNKETIVKWVWFVLNKIKEKEKQKTNTLYEFYDEYKEKCKPLHIKNKERIKKYQKIIFFTVFIILFLILCYLYNQ